MADDDEPQEVEEINEDTIKQLAAEAAGGGDDEEEEEEEQEMQAPEPSGGGNADVQIEKIKSTIDMLKEQNSSTGDRLQTVSQSVGEIRQMVHEQESEFNEIEVDIDKMKDQLEDLDPDKLSKKLNDVQSQIGANEATIQKLEDKLQRVGQTANDARETLKQLGSMDNLIEMNKEFDEKLSEIKEAERYIERLASKSEKINIQINKKMSEYSTYKARVDAIQEKVNDMFRKLDETSIEVQDAVKEDELEQTRERIKEVEDQVEEFQNIAPLAEMSLPEPIVELRDERRDIENFLEELEQKRKKGKIDESKYDEIKEANEEKLEVIRKKLVQEWKDLESASENMPEPGEESSSESGSGSGGNGEEGGSEDSAQDDESAEGEGSAEEEGGEDAQEETKDDFAAIVEQSVEDVKEEVKNKNLDLDKLIEAEENGQNRDTLVEWLETKNGSGDDEEEIDYEEMMDQPAEDVKKAVESNDVDLTEVIKAERSGQNRNELLEWIEGKIAEQ